MKKKNFFHLTWANCIAACFFLFTSLGCINAAAQTDPPDSIRKILDAHNAYRTEVGVPPLTWSDDLARFAQKWANELANNGDCELKHRPADENDPWKQLYGENIYSGGGSDMSPTIIDAVAAWGEEKMNFDFDTKDCKSGEMCGHFTQMIWKNTTAVGCAIAVCPDGNVIVVCNYDPSGNWGGETPF